MKSFFTTHVWMKLLSVGIAAGLWFFVHGEQHLEIHVSVKAEPANLPPELTIVSGMESRIHLRISGPRTRVTRITDATFKPYTLDLAGAKPGIVSFRVYESDFDVPRGTRVTRVAPEVIRLRLETVEERTIPVEPIFSGDPDEVAELSGSNVSPKLVKVRGPRSIVDKLVSARTEPIDLHGKKEPFEMTVEVRPPLPRVEVDPSKVLVKVDLRAKPPAKGKRRS